MFKSINLLALINGNKSYEIWESPARVKALLDI